MQFFDYIDYTSSEYNQEELTVESSPVVPDNAD